MARSPSKAEAALLNDLLGKQLERYGGKDADPWTILVNEIGERLELAENIDPVNAAAWTVVSRVLLNMDETITKD